MLNDECKYFASNLCWFFLCWFPFCLGYFKSDTLQKAFQPSTDLHFLEFIAQIKIAKIEKDEEDDSTERRETLIHIETHQMTVY